MAPSPRRLLLISAFKGSDGLWLGYTRRLPRRQAGNEPPYSPARCELPAAPLLLYRPAPLLKRLPAASCPLPASPPPRNARVPKSEVNVVKNVPY